RARVSPSTTRCPPAMRLRCTARSPRVARWQLTCPPRRAARAIRRRALVRRRLRVTTQQRAALAFTGVETLQLSLAGALAMALGALLVAFAGLGRREEATA